MKNYFTSYNIYEVSAVCQNKSLFAYAVDSSIIGALCIAHEHMNKDYEIVKIKKSETKAAVIMPVERTSDYKLFYADLHGQWSGIQAYVIAGSLSVAGSLLEEYCGTYYTLSEFKEIRVDALYVSPRNPDNLEE